MEPGDLRGADTVARRAMAVSVGGGIDREDDGFASCLLGAVEDFLRGGVVRVEIHLLEGDLVLLLEHGDLFHRHAS